MYKRQGLEGLISTPAPGIISVVNKPEELQKVLVALAEQNIAVLDLSLIHILGVESTVLDLTSEIPTILRPGGITKEQLESVLGDVDTNYKEDGDRPSSPGCLLYTSRCV